MKYYSLYSGRGIYQIYQTHEACIEVVAQSTVVYKVGVAPTENRAHEACIEVST